LAIRDLSVHERTPVIREAKKIHERAQKIAEELNNEIMQAEIYSAIGEDYHYLGNRAIAQEHILKALEIWKVREMPQDEVKDQNFLRKHGYTI